MNAPSSVRHWLAPVVALGLLVSSSTLPSAHADEAERIAQATALVEKLVALRKAHDRPALALALPLVAPLHNALDDEAARGKLQGAVGDLLVEEELASTRLVAAKTLGDLHDERAWTQLKRAVPAPEIEAALPLHIAAVEAAGRVAAPASATVLLDLVKKGRDPNMIRTGVTALSGFGWAKNRVMVMEELVELIGATQPGRGGGARGVKVSPETAAAWEALRPVLLKSLNDLTGRAELTLDAWIALLKANKKKPESLFLRAR